MSKKNPLFRRKCSHYMSDKDVQDPDPHLNKIDPDPYFRVCWTISVFFI